MVIIRVLKKFSIILSRHQKHRIVELLILMIVGGFLETCSVSLVLPFMEVVINPDKTMERKFIKELCHLFNIQSTMSFLGIISLLLVFVFLFKNVYLLFEYGVQFKFVYGNMFDLQSRLLNTLINRPYEYFMGINSGEIVRIISNDTASSFNILISVLNMFTELVVSLMLIITIAIISPIITLFVAVLLIVLLVLIFVIIRPILRRVGTDQMMSLSGMNKWLLQSIQGIKEVKVMQKENFFQNKYNENGQLYVHSLRWNQLLKNTPRFIIESVCMGVMFMGLACFIFAGVELDTILPMLTAVAMAAVRLLPSANRISMASSQLAYGEPMIDKLIENLQRIEPKQFKLVSKVNCGSKSIKRFVKCIEYKDISYHYPNAEENVLSHISFSILKGESIGIVGPSGSGKTTTIDVALGLLDPTQGEILIDGVNIKEDIGGWLSQVGYIPQSIFMLDGTIRENVAFGVAELDICDEDVWRALNDASLADFVKSLPKGIDTEVGERGMKLSGGQRQRIGIARALYNNPEVLVFDEATSALDNDTEKAIMDSINGLHGEKTMIIIAHRLSTIEACDHVYRVENSGIIKER